MEVLGWGLDVQFARWIFILRQGMVSDSAILTSVRSSFHQYGTTTEKEPCQR